MTSAFPPIPWIRATLIGIMSCACLALSADAIAQQQSADLEIRQHEQKPPLSAYEAQKQLIHLTRVTQDLLNTLGQLRRVDPVLLQAVNTQYVTLQAMPASEFEMFADSGVDLLSMIDQVNELNALLKEYSAEVIPANEFGATIAAVLPAACPIYTGRSDELFPPGPCGIDGLSDTAYPYTVCPVSVSTGVMWITRAVKVASFVLSEVAEKLCYQALFGNNGSLICIATDIVFVAAVTTLDYFDKCNGRRTAAETMGTYERLGDIFVNNKSSFAAQHASAIQTFNRVGVTNSALESDLADARAKIDTSLENGFEGTQSLLTEIETQAIKNAQALDQALAEQLAIMQLLGISHLHSTPGNNAVSPNDFAILPPPYKSRQLENASGTGIRLRSPDSTRR